MQYDISYVRSPSRGAAESSGRELTPCFPFPVALGPTRPVPIRLFVFAVATRLSRPLSSSGLREASPRPRFCCLSRLFPSLAVLYSSHLYLSGIPSYAISFTTKSSSLASSTVSGYPSKLYQAWTGVVPKGASGDSNAESTDVCGVKSRAYHGQWKYVDLISEGVSLISSDGQTSRLTVRVRRSFSPRQVPRV
jgi:hypothetical protein